MGGLLPVLLDALDGSQDRVGSSTIAEDASSRYKQVKTIRVNTVDIMEAKLWLCRVLQLVVTMRLDIRLSLFLDRYQQKWNEGAFGNATAGGADGRAASGRPHNSRRGSVMDSLNASVGDLAKNVGAVAKNVRRRSLGYLRLVDPADDPASYERIFDVLRLDNLASGSQVGVVHVLLGACRSWPAAAASANARGCVRCAMSISAIRCSLRVCVCGDRASRGHRPDLLRTPGARLRRDGSARAPL